MPTSSHPAASARRRAVARWRRSGLAAADFAPLLGVTASTLYNWSRLVRRDEAEGSAPGSMIEIVPAPPSGAATSESRGMIEIELRSGRTLRLSGDVDPDLLARVLRVAEDA